MDRPTTRYDEEAVVPIGIPGLDRFLEGGITWGEAVLVLGSFGAGHREFLRTAAIMHGNWQAESGLFELEYDGISTPLERPAKVRYLATTESEDRLHHCLSYLTDEEWFAPAIEHVDWECYGGQFSGLGSIRPAESVFEFEDDLDPSRFRRFFRQFAEPLLTAEDGTMLIMDSLSDLLPVALKYLDWPDLFFISQTMNELIEHSKTILLVGADVDILSSREEALLRRTFCNVIDFEWVGTGSSRRRAMRIEKFHRFLREAGDASVTFEIAIESGQFGISDVKKIPPSRG